MAIAATYGCCSYGYCVNTNVFIRFDMSAESEQGQLNIG